MVEYGIRVLIARDQQVVADVAVTGTSVLIGSGGHCDVRLGPDLLAIEQVALRLEEGVVWGRALTQAPAVTLGDKPFSSGIVSASDALRVGPLSIEVAAWHDPVPQQPGHKRFIPLMLLLSMLALLAMGAAVSRQVAKVAPLPEPPTTPFSDADAKAATGCPEHANASASAVAGDRWREAVDHRERSPFSPESGLEAVRLFNAAASCFDTSGDRDSAEAARSQAALLRAQLEKSFHVHRVRLDHSLSQKDFSLSRVEVNILKSFLAGRDHPYAAWLDNLARWLDVTQGKRQIP